MAQLDAAQSWPPPANHQHQHQAPVMVYYGDGGYPAQPQQQPQYIHHHHHHQQHHQHQHHHYGGANGVVMAQQGYHVIPQQQQQHQLHGQHQQQQPMVVYVQQQPHYHHHDHGMPPLMINADGSNAIQWVVPQRHGQQQGFVYVNAGGHGNGGGVMAAPASNINPKAPHQPAPNRRGGAPFVGGHPQQRPPAFVNAGGASPPMFTTAQPHGHGERPERYKTAICRHAASGRCLRGAACRFAHGAADLRTEATNIAAGLTTFAAIEAYINSLMGIPSSSSGAPVLVATPPPAVPATAEPAVAETPASLEEEASRHCQPAASQP